ncbi:MAG: TlpA disulfide reductase family protein [Sediminibacterium sp.]
MRMILLVLLMAIAGCREPISEKKTAPAPEKKTMAKIRLADLNGKPIDLEQFTGKILFINFWATWCKPCIQEMSSIKNAQRLLSKNEIVFLVASNESPEQIIDFKETHDFNFNYVHLLNMEELNLEALPTTYIFNGKGDLVFSEMGYREWDDTNNIKMILNIKDQK